MMHRLPHHYSTRNTLVRTVLLLALVALFPATAHAKANVGFSLYAASGTPGQTVTLKSLVYSGGAPVSGLQIDFSVHGTPVGSAVSGASNAALSYAIPSSMTAGIHNVTVAFTGNSSYNVATRTTAALTVAVPKANVGFSLYAASGTPGQTVTLKSLVYSGGAPVSGLQIDFSVDGTPVGSAVSGASNAELSYKIPASMAAGIHNVTVTFAGNSSYNVATRTTAALTVAVPKTNVSFSLYAASGTQGQTVTLKSLVYSGGAPASGLTVAFAIDGTPVGSAVSGSSYAELSYKIPASMAAGIHNVTVTFAGNSSYNAATRTTAALTVKVAKTNVSFSLYAVNGTPGQTVMLKSLVYSGGNPVSGLTVQFAIDGNSVGSATSDSSGAALSYTIPLTMTPGLRNVTASFAGDATHNAATRTTAALTVKATHTNSLTGRWEGAKTGPGDAVGGVGALGLLLTQSGSSITGSFIGCAISNGVFISGLFTGEIIYEGVDFDISVNLSEDGMTLAESYTVNNGDADTAFPFTLQRVSDDPAIPDLIPPVVNAISPASGQTEVARSGLVIAIMWSKPVHGWDAKLIGRFGGIASSYGGSDLIDQTKNTYDPDTHTYTMYLKSSITLDPLTTYSLTLDEGMVDWRDVYGVPAWTDTADAYTISFTTGL